MKVGQNISFYVYDKVQKEEEKKSSNNIFVGDLAQDSMMKSMIDLKKEQARKQAMNIVRSQFESDQKIDQMLEDRYEKLEMLKQEADNYNKMAGTMREEKAKTQKAMQEMCGIDENSQEHQDYLLMAKAKKEGVGSLSEDELNRLANMGPLTEYQSAMLAYDEVIDYYDGLKEDALKGIANESKAISAMKLEILKYDSGIIKAQKMAAAIEQKASREIVGMLLEDAKDHMDEKMEELKEQARETAEKRKEEQERLDGKKKEENDTEEFIYEMQDATQQQKKMEDDLQEIMEKNKLLEEDLKGITVDENI